MVRVNNPKWAVLIPTGTSTREFGRFVPDVTTGMVLGGPIEHAAIFRAVSGEPAYAIAFGFDNDPSVGPGYVTVDLPQPFTPSGGDFGYDLRLVDAPIL